MPQFKGLDMGTTVNYSYLRNPQTVAMKIEKNSLDRHRKYIYLIYAGNTAFILFSLALSTSMKERHHDFQAFVATKSQLLHLFCVMRAMVMKSRLQSN